MILNLTQHVGTPEQGVTEPTNKAEVQALLTFENLPTAIEVAERAGKLACLAHESGAESAMIGGAPFLMGPLAETLKGFGIKPLFAFSRRESVETVNADGSVSKTAVFRHCGFVEG